MEVWVAIVHKGQVRHVQTPGRGRKGGREGGREVREGVEGRQGEREGGGS